MKHPGKTAAQRRVLDEIGCGNNSPIAAKATIQALLAAGLIVQLPDRLLGGDRFGQITIRQYEMPIPVYYQWCKVMAADYADG